ncbi:MAG: C10 family peptidase [Bacteroidaceae bacterium]|nr:C10 family peptidase [Bacteroidaceae bacterium]
MNKTILLIACWLLGLTPGMAQQRKMADIKHIADSILSCPTRWGKKAKAVKTRRVITASELQTGQQDAFYICEAGDDGYAVISADERMTPVLGFSKGRSFDPRNIPVGMQELLDGYVKEYEALRNGMPLKLNRRLIEGMQELVGPLLLTQWGQNAPFNNKCPMWNGERCITGCVAISTAQTLCYYQYPDSAIGHVEYVTRTNQIPIEENLQAIKFNWPYIRDTYKDGTTERERDAVADLVYVCAIAAEMDFGLKESSATSTRQVKALVEKFGYDPDMACIHKDYMTTNEWQTIMLNELNSLRPIIYAATSPTEGGHSFVIDGYKADEDGYPFYHVNWGWEGNCDDYFKLSAMEAGNYDFVQGHEAIIGIQPDNGEQDRECIWQAEEVVLSSARINPNFTHNFTITLKNIFNYSYKTFSGKIEAYLKNDKGEEILVGSTQKLNGVPFSYGIVSINIRSSLPNDFAEGDYTLVLRSKVDGSEKWETLTYPSPLTLTVTTITESYTPNMMVNELLNLGEGLEDLSVSLRVTFPLNYAAKPFTGSLRMAVADSEGNLITPFGNVANLANMEQLGYLPKAITFEGKLPDYLEDGQYRFYIVAKQSGYLEWGKVTGFKFDTGTFGEELYIPFWLEEGRIIYHKETEEELPEFYANLQVTDMQVTSFNADTRCIEMQMSNVLNYGSEQFVGQFSMVIYDEADSLLTAFGNTQKLNVSLGSYQMYPNTFDFSGNLPEELEDGNYTVKIAAKQNGYRGWSPLKGWVKEGNTIMKHDIDLGFGFIIMNRRMYKVDTDGISEVKNERVKSEKYDNTVYDLSGRKVNVQCKPGIYIVGGKKVVK